MENISIDDLIGFVEQNISSFHEQRLHLLSNLKLRKILERKNPYLFKAKNILTAQDLVKGILDAHLSSQEETIFGEFLEKLAIFVNGKVFTGRKSSTKGIDLEFEKDGKRFIVNIKSGPNWGNSSQIREMLANFKTAKITLRTTGGSDLEIVAINGCCYGRNNITDKGEYFNTVVRDFGISFQEIQISI